MTRSGWPVRIATLAVTACFAPPWCDAAAQDPGWFPSDSTVRAILAEAVAAGTSRGLVVGLLDADGSRRVIAYGDPGSDALPLDAESVFEIGSMTKVFTGIVLADMSRRGEVDLNDPVADHLPPDVRVPIRDGGAITLLDLATHHSGLPTNPGNLAPSDPRDPFGDYTVRRLYDFVSEYELPRDPGEAFVYSNVGMALLGEALAERAGTTYGALVRERILAPLEMSHTAIELTPWMREHLVQGHDRAREPMPNWELTGIAGAGALRSNAGDMLIFAAANLSRDSTDLVLAMRESHGARRSMGPDPAYPGRQDLVEGGRVGLSWFISRPGERTIMFTAGLTGGYSSFLGLDLEAGRAVVLLSNTGLTSVDHIGFHLLDPTVPLESGG